MKIKWKLNLNFSVVHCYQVQFKILIFDTFDITVSSKSNSKSENTFQTENEKQRHHCYEYEF